MVAIKRHLYSGPFTLRKAASFYLSALIVRTYVALPCLYMYFAHSCTECRPRLLPSGSEAMLHKNYLCYATGCVVHDILYSLFLCWNVHEKLEKVHFRFQTFVQE